MRQESEPQCKVCFSLRTFVLYLIKIRSNSVNVTVSPSRSRRNWELIGYLVGRRVRWAPIGTTALVLCFVLMTGTRENHAAHFWLYPHVPVGIHLSSALLVIRDQLLVNLPAVLHVGQRILLIPFPHHKQDYNDWKTAESGWHQDTFEILSLAAAALIAGDNGIISLQCQRWD